MKLNEAREAVAKYLLEMAIKANPLILRGPTVGKSYLDAGFVYAPYVPLQVTPMLLSDKSEARPDASMSVKEARRLIAIGLRRRDNEFNLRKGIVTQYSKMKLRTDFYGKVTIWESKK